MRFVLERVSNPEIEPMLLAEMKRHLRLFDDITDEDDDVEGLILGARQWVEQHTGRALIDQAWRLTLSDTAQLWDPAQSPPPGCYGTTSARGEILLRRSPVLSIVSFVSVDAAGEETAVDVASYELREADSKWPKVVGLSGATWGTGTYRITLRAGYANRDISPAEGAEVVPRCFMDAMKLYAEALYDRDEKMMDRLMGAAEMVVQQERIYSGFA